MNDEPVKASENSADLFTASDQLRAAKDWLELLGKVFLVGFGVSFATGFIIVNSYRQSIGSIESSLFQVEYVSAGVLWWFLFASAVATFKIWRLLLRPVNPFSNSVDRNVRTILKFILALVFIVGGTLFMLSFVFGILSGGSVNLFTLRGALLVPQLLLAAHFFRSIFWEVRPFFREAVNLRKTSDYSGLRRFDWFFVIFFISFVLSSISAFGIFHYPEFNRQFGGGKPRNVRIAIQPESNGLFKSLDISVDNETYLSEPLKLLSESESSYFVQRSSENIGSFFPEQTMPIIVVKKSLIQAAVVDRSVANSTNEQKGVVEAREKP